VFDDPREADVGAILAWGFAPWTGGPFPLSDQTGLEEFVAQADDYAARYGDRFAPPQLLRDMAARGETFYGNFAGKQKAAA
jgi:3-hydroxyacyl-CoA dehydrogenase/enoyl-CoA hydratase/3-hydroxybutyryl-CoA epimerase